MAIGLAFAVRLAHALGRVGADDIVNHDEVLKALGLSGWLPEEFEVDELIRAMGHDKKANHDLTFVLNGADGFEVVRAVDPSVVADALASFRGEQ